VERDFVRESVWLRVEDRADAEWRMEDMWFAVVFVWDRVDWMNSCSGAGR